MPFQNEDGFSLLNEDDTPLEQESGAPAAGGGPLLGTGNLIDAMYYAGDFIPGQTILLPFNSQTAEGDAITLAGSPACRVYKGSSATESSAGVTLTVDFDSRTGLHLVSIDTTADTSFYASGADFTVVLTAGTVDGADVSGRVLGRFSINNRSRAVGEVTVISPISETGDTITLQRGDDYDVDSGNALEFSSSDWPVLTGGNVVFKVGGNSYTATVAGAQSVRVELTRTQTAALTGNSYMYELEATLSNSLVRTLLRGTLTMIGQL